MVAVRVRDEGTVNGQPWVDVEVSGLAVESALRGVQEIGHARSLVSVAPRKYLLLSMDVITTIVIRGVQIAIGGGKMIKRFGSDRQAQTALAIVRIVAGVIFMAHGYQKFFMMGLPGVTGFFGGLGVPLPGVMAAVIATLELAGGFALLIGFFGRLIAIPLALDIAGAITLVHAKNGFFVPNGIEFVMLLMFSAIAIAVAGPGRFSVDSVFARGPARD